MIKRKFSRHLLLVILGSMTIPKNTAFSSASPSVETSSAAPMMDIDYQDQGYPAQRVPVVSPENLKFLHATPPQEPPEKKRKAEDGTGKATKNIALSEPSNRKTPHTLDKKKPSPKDALLKKFTLSPERDEDTFKDIISERIHVLLPDFKIDVQSEEAQGSRRWVKDFPIVSAETEQEVQTWHRTMNKAIGIIQRTKQTFYNKSKPKKTCLSTRSNMLIARLRVISKKTDTVEDTPLKLFFNSGFPSDNVYNGQLLEKLAHEMKTALEGADLDENFDGYQIRTLTTKGNDKIALTKKDDEVKAEFKEDLTNLFNVDNPEGGILGPDRLTEHKKCLDYDEKFAWFHYHSEQALRKIVNQKIYLYKKENPFDIEHVKCFILDICSYYDMCWICSDTLTRCGVLNHQGDDMNLVVRCSGLTKYADQSCTSHKSGKPHPCLRKYKKKFLGYKFRKAWTLQDEDEGYKPYTAQALVKKFTELEL